MTRHLPWGWLRYQSSPWEERVEQVCASWVPTRYRLNACKKGVGVDCIHFVAAVLDELFGSEHSKNLSSLPPDACIHNTAGVIAAAKSWLTKYPSYRAEDGSIEAGDVVCLGHRDAVARTQHVLIAGGRGRLWHSCSVVGVTCTGYGWDESLTPVAIYRPENKELWTPS